MPAILYILWQDTVAMHGICMTGGKCSNSVDTMANVDTVAMVYGWKCCNIMWATVQVGSAVIL